MRVLIVAAALLAVALPAAESALGKGGHARLSITVWPEGRHEGKPVKKLALRCGPAGGSHPTPARACRRLFASLSALRPVPAGRVCTNRDGGPAQALVSGRVNGRRVWTTFNRKNGCQITRWDRLAPLFRAQDGPTSLHVTVWPKGQGQGSYETLLTCDPAGGTHPSPASACARLEAVEDPFGPLRLELPCVLVASGPQLAVVRGSFRWKPVETQFNRSDSCETRRWDRLAILFAAP
jgi:Subtilisin inhibitor-like